MSTFKQSCPGCGRGLELPADAKGRLGKCPACDVTFTIGEVREAAADSVMALPETDMRGSETASLQVTACEIEDVLSTTWSIFRAHLWVSIWPVVATAIVAGLVVVLPLYLLYDVYAGGSTKLAVFGFVLVGPFSFVCGVFLWLSLVRAQILVARGERAPFSEIAPPAIIFWRGLALSLCFFLGAAAVCLVMYMLTTMMDAAGAVVLARIIGLLSLLVSVALWFGLMWYSWSWMYICGDGKGTPLGSMRAALSITQENKLTSFFLVLISVVLALLGTLMCLVGHVVTLPLTLLMFAVAYLLMTGQSTDDPNAPNR